MHNKELISEIDTYIENNYGNNQLFNLLTNIKHHLQDVPVDKTIREISLMFPNCDDGTILTYEVGRGGVTQIKEVLKNGEYSQIKYYEIWKDDYLYAELHHYTQIIYKENIN